MAYQTCSNLIYSFAYCAIAKINTAIVSMMELNAFVRSKFRLMQHFFFFFFIRSFYSHQTRELRLLSRFFSFFFFFFFDKRFLSDFFHNFPCKTWLAQFYWLKSLGITAALLCNMFSGTNKWLALFSSRFFRIFIYFFLSAPYNF